MMHLFSTRMGLCGIDFVGSALRRVSLPGPGQVCSATQLPKSVAAAVRAIDRHLGGCPQDLRAIEIETESVPPFHRRVYEAARRVPPGMTTTYGDLAREVGAPNAARAVGQAMARNPLLIVIPCHRVLASGGAIGGFSAPGGAATKRRLLAIEGAWPLSPAVALPFDPQAAVEHLTRADAILGHLIARVGALRLRIEAEPSLFFALGRAIIYQQLSGKAAATIHARYRLLFDDGVPSPARHLALAQAAVRDSGVSGSKALALGELAKKCLNKELPTLRDLAKLSADEVVMALTAVRGIGPWTAQMLLIFRFGRPDILPVDDYGVRKGFQKLYHTCDLPTRSELARHAERWAPYRSVASWYLWRALEPHDGD